MAGEDGVHGGKEQTVARDYMDGPTSTSQELACSFTRQLSCLISNPSCLFYVFATCTGRSRTSTTINGRSRHRQRENFYIFFYRSAALHINVYEAEALGNSGACMSTNEC
jgi:hypothetical protein